MGDTLDGWTGNDTLRGDDGNDSILGFDGADDLRGGPGDDSMTGENDGDILRDCSATSIDSGNGGAGTDTCELSIETRSSCEFTFTSPPNC